MLTAWSTLTVETSPEPSPSLSTCTRAPSKPRTIGRPTPGPKYDDCTPGSLLTVSPRELALASSRRAPDSTSTGNARLSAVSGSGVAETSTASRVLAWGWRGSAWSAGIAARARIRGRTDRLMEVCYIITHQAHPSKVMPKLRPKSFHL